MNGVEEMAGQTSCGAQIKYRVPFPFSPYFSHGLGYNFFFADAESVYYITIIIADAESYYYKLNNFYILKIEYITLF